MNNPRVRADLPMVLASMVVNSNSNTGEQSNGTGYGNW